MKTVHFATKAAAAAMKTAAKAAAARGLGGTRHGKRHCKQKGSCDAGQRPPYPPSCSIVLDLFHR
jgi:hypothetical protein